ncbi:MAG: right-handed parallel beta-helix repeat-containing protein, partial [Candidatus Methylarchaceae archaeon HK01B]|nr:right-handed parallel beta-helix repeat-containing protein [Candidatus Methylarchaceae archaeon HK01B]
NTIRKNVVTNNNHGIYLYYSSSNTVRNNVVTNNDIGINLHSSSSNTIRDNVVINSKNYGIYLYYSSSNKIYHNNIIDNTVQAYDYGGTGNSWDDGYPSGGNYWSDYPSVDYYRGPNQDQPGSDGIGDTPYLFEYNQDNYPLMEPY